MGKQVIVAAGSNDWHQTANNYAKTRENLKQIFDELKGAGYDVIYIPPNKDFRSLKDKKECPNLKPACILAAEEAGVTVLKEDFTYESDRVHLTMDSIDKIRAQYPNAQVIGDSNAEKFENSAVGIKLPDNDNLRLKNQQTSVIKGFARHLVANENRDQEVQQAAPETNSGSGKSSKPVQTAPLPAKIGDNSMMVADSYKAVAAEYVSYDRVFKDIFSKYVFSDDYLIINDIFFTNVPASNISFTSDNGVHVIETLRSNAPIVTPRNSHGLSVSIVLIFNLSDPDSADKLERLIAETSAHPLLYIYNNKIKRNLGAETSESTIFILENASISTDPNSVNSIILDLSLHYFNYKPFSSFFWYNQSLPGTQKKASQEDVKQDNNNLLFNLTGFEPSSYLINKTSKEFIENFRRTRFQLEKDKTINDPTPFPAASDSWMYLADHLHDSLRADGNRQILDNCDYIKFNFHRFQEVAPPEEARFGTGSSAHLIDPNYKFPTYQKWYMAGTAVGDNELYAKNSGSGQEAEHGNNNKKGARYGSNTDWVPKLEGGYPDWSQFSEQGPPAKGVIASEMPWAPATYKTKTKWIIKGKNPKLEKVTGEFAYTMDERDVFYLARALDFETSSPTGKTVIAWMYLTSRSGTTRLADYVIAHSSTQSNKWLKQGAPHIQARRFAAHSLKWEGEITKESKAVAKALALGDLPRPALFSEAIAEGWLPHDYGSQEKLKDRVNKKLISPGASDYIVQTDGRTGFPFYDFKEEDIVKHLDEKWEVKGGASGVNVAEKGSNGKAIQDKAKAAIDAAVEAASKAAASAIGDAAIAATATLNGEEYKKAKGKAKDPEERINWIKNICEKNNFQYYTLDPFVKNVFYQTSSCEISGNPADHSNGIVLNGIVPASVSLVYGHRIVPQRVIGLTSPTWQFLGAGNRSGVINFVFAGEEGRKSADKIKQLYHSARENAVRFSQVITEAGTIELIWDDPNGKRNNIFSLLNIHHIVISEISESSIPEHPDKHQLSISFVAQDFKKENSLQAFSSEFENKKSIIKTLMGCLESTRLPGEETDYRGRIIKAKSEYGKVEEKGGNEDYATVYMSYNTSKHPKWFIDLVFEAASVCQKANYSSPATKYVRDKSTGKTWADLYADYDADKIIYGIGYLQGSSISTVDWRKMTIFDYNGKRYGFIENPKQSIPEVDASGGVSINGFLSLFKDYQPRIFYEWIPDSTATSAPETGVSTRSRAIANPGKWTEIDVSSSSEFVTGLKQAADNFQIKEEDFSIVSNESADKLNRAFNTWTKEMDALVSKAMQYMTEDSKNFKDKFKMDPVAILSSVHRLSANCYDDLNMPENKNLEYKLKFSPEFYVYDDSNFNPAIANATDKTRMKEMLDNHIKNEEASVRYYTEQTMLGGRYVSKDLPKMLKERQATLEAFSRRSGDVSGYVTETDFFHPDRMLLEGTKVWDPTIYRPNDGDEYPQEQEEVYEGAIGKIREWITNLFSDTDMEGSVEEDIAGEGATDNTKKAFFYRSLAANINNILGKDRIWTDKPFTTSEYRDSFEKMYMGSFDELLLGPNKQYSNVDSKLAGYPVKSTEEQMIESMAKTAKKENKTQIYSSGEGLNLVKYHVKPNGDVVVATNIEKPDTTGETAGNVAVVVGGTVVGITAAALLAKGAVLALGAIPVYGWAALAIIGAGYLLYKTFDYFSGENEVPTKGLMLKDQKHLMMYEKLKDNTKEKRVKSAIESALGMKAKDLSIRKVYPSFKIYFIEDDAAETELSGGKIIRAFDDFYSYSAIQEIKVTRSRRIAGDMAYIRISNVSGKLFKKRYSDTAQAPEKVYVKGNEVSNWGIDAEYATGIYANTELENPFSKLILQNGVKVQIRLGYANDPEFLDTVFLGQIVEIVPSEEGKIVELVCQGYGAELESIELGDLDTPSVFYSSQEALSSAIIQNTIVNFGRQARYNKFMIGEARHSFTGGLGQDYTGKTYEDLIGWWGTNGMHRLFYRHQWMNYPQDDNIYAPSPKVYSTNWNNFWDNACIYRPILQTPWDIFKEHELRHPGYISLAVPYGHEPRMTMFFGAKGQNYWSRPPTKKEVLMSELLADNATFAKGISLEDARNDPNFHKTMEDIAKKSPGLASAIVEDLNSVGAPVNIGRELGAIFGRYIPFRNYFFFDSEHHILHNQIRTSRDGVYNQVVVQYSLDEDGAEEHGMEDVKDDIEKVAGGRDGVFSTKLDDNIPDEAVVSNTESFLSCVTDYMAKRYAQGLFARYLRDGYKGELIVLGESLVKPYDICYISDQTINMTGPIEVESVTHIFNRESGFVSIITPDMCVDINEYYSLTAMDLAGMMLSSVFPYGMSGIGATAVAGAAGLAIVGAPVAGVLFLGIGALSIFGTAGAIKFHQYLEGEGTPVVHTPLMLQGAPFVSTAIQYKNSSMWTTWGGVWRQWWDDLEKGWADYDVAEEFGGWLNNAQAYIFATVSSNDAIAETENNIEED